MTNRHFFIIAASLLFGSAASETYFGEIHGHTSFSDGRRPAEFYFRFARDKMKLDFAFIADHDCGNCLPFDSLTPDAWQRLQAVARKFTREGSFVAIPGYEWTWEPDPWTRLNGAVSARGFGHKVVYFRQDVPDIFRAQDRRHDTPDKLAEALLAWGGLAHTAHPTPGGRLFEYDPAFDTCFQNCEMADGAAGPNHRWTDFRSEEAFVLALKARHHLGIVGGSDTHESLAGCGAKTAVIAPELTRTAIFDALRHRRCYATTRTHLRIAFSIQNHPMGSELLLEGPRPTLLISATHSVPLRRVQVLKNGLHVAHEWTDFRQTHLSWQGTWEDANFRNSAWYWVRICQADANGDGHEELAWTSPIWVYAPKTLRAPLIRGLYVRNAPLLRDQAIEVDLLTALASPPSRMRLDLGTQRASLVEWQPVAKGTPLHFPLRIEPGGSPWRAGEVVHLRLTCTDGLGRTTQLHQSYHVLTP